MVDLLGAVGGENARGFGEAHVDIKILVVENIDSIIPPVAGARAGINAVLQ